MGLEMRRIFWMIWVAHCNHKDPKSMEKGNRRVRGDIRTEVEFGVVNLEMKEESKFQEIQMSSRTWKRQGNNSPLEPLKGM